MNTAQLRRRDEAVHPAWPVYRNQSLLHPRGHSWCSQRRDAHVKKGQDALSFVPGQDGTISETAASEDATNGDVRLDLIASIITFDCYFSDEIALRHR